MNTNDSVFVGGVIVMVMVAMFAALIMNIVYGLNTTVEVEKGTTTSCDEVGDIGKGDTYVECRRVDALVDKERRELNNALENAWASPDKGDDLIAEQLCQFRPYKECEKK